MTLKAQIAADADDVFLNTDEFATSITHRPLGVTANGVTINAIMDLDHESPGDASGKARWLIGRGVDDLEGSRIERVGELQLSIDITVTCNERSNNRDTFVINGELWAALRILWQDDGMQGVLVERKEGISTRRGASH